MVLNGGHANRNITLLNGLLEFAPRPAILQFVMGFLAGQVSGETILDRITSSRGVISFQDVNGRMNRSERSYLFLDRWPCLTVSVM